MPYRIHPISQGEIYHVFNRSVGNIPIFLNQRDYKRAIEVISFYNYSNPPVRFSYFNRLTPAEKSQILTELETVRGKQIDLLSFCLMPDHLHFLIKEIKKDGISTFMRNLQNSYAKYFNLRTERHGALFQSMFKAVRIETEEQLLHVCRYIHINPYVSFLVKNIEKLEDYPWSSFPDYLGKRNLKFVESKFILNHYSSTANFIKFTLDQLDFRRKLKNINHLSFESGQTSFP